MEKSLTILQVISQRHLSGAERVCLMLSESLQRRGHRVVLVCKRDTAMLEEADRTWMRALKDTFGSRLAYAVDEPTERSPEPAWTLWTWPAYKPERVVAYRLTRTLRMPVVKPKPGWKELEAEGRVLRGRNP